MSYTKQNFQPNAVLTAAQLNAMDNQIYDNAEYIGELKEDLTVRENLHETGSYELKNVNWYNKFTTSGEISGDSNIRITSDKIMLPLNAIARCKVLNSNIRADLMEYDANAVLKKQYNSTYALTSTPEYKYVRYQLRFLDNSQIVADDWRNYLKIELLYDISKYVAKSIVNLLDASKTVEGTIASGGNIVSGSTYRTSEPIHLSVGESITISPKLRKFMAYKNPNDLSSYISSSYVTNETAAPHTYTATEECYIRFSYRLVDEYKTQAEYGTTYTTYKPYGYAMEDVHISDNQKKEASVLFGKKWAHCGDSFSAYTDAQFSSGIYEGKDKTFPRIISEKNGMELVQFFASGRTLAFPAVPADFINSLTCQGTDYYYQNIPTNADYITIMLGINDGHHRSSSSGGDREDNTGIIPLGTINDNTVNTYYGAWNVVLTWLLTNRPFSHIGIIVSNGVDTMDYRTAQIEVAKKYGIPYIDLNGDERTPAMIRPQNSNISDEVKQILVQKQAVDADGSKTGSVDTHPNAKAHEFESIFIESWLKTI